MALPWREKFQLSDALAVRRFEETEDARMYLEAKYPDASEKERESALQEARQDGYKAPGRPEITYQPTLPEVVAVVYLMGASLGQLAKVTGMSRSSLFGMIDRKVDKQMRNDARRGRKLTAEGVGRVYVVTATLAGDGTSLPELIKMVERGVGY